MVVFNVRQDINNLNNIEFGDISNVAGNINLLSEANNLDSCGHQKVIFLIDLISYYEKITTYPI